MILDIAREQVLERGVGLDEAQTLEVLRLPDEAVDDLLALAHDVRMRHCGPEVEIEGIVSIKTGGCPEDCHFCSQSGRFETPVRAVRLDIPSLVEAARQTAATGATEFCIVAAVRGPDERLMAQVREGVKAITDNVEINVACSLGILTREQGVELAELGVHRYNHNLETARSHFGNVVTTHTWEERWETLQLVRELGMEVCCGGIIGMGETLEQRAELAAQFAALDPDEVPLNFLDPRPGTPFADLEPVPAQDALRTIAAFRLALPRTILRFAGGRELTLGDLGARQGMVGGINAVIVGNYLTTLGRDPQEDLDLLAELSMPVKELSEDAVTLLRGLREAGRRGRARALPAPARPAALLRELRAQAQGPGPARPATRRSASAAPDRARAAARAAHDRERAGAEGDARRPRGAAAVLERLPRAGGRPAAARRRRGGRAALGRRRGRLAAGEREHGPAPRAGRAAGRAQGHRGVRAVRLRLPGQHGRDRGAGDRRDRGARTRSTTPRSSTAAGWRGRRRSSIRTARSRVAPT